MNCSRLVYYANFFTVGSGFPDRPPADEVWSRQALAKHIRAHAVEAGYSALSRAAKATVHRILAPEYSRASRKSTLLPLSTAGRVSMRSPQINKVMFL